MRAVIAADGIPVITDLPVPTPAPGEVLVRVHATAINRADLLQVGGRYPPPPGASEIIGLELAGEIAETGQRVMALVAGGGYADYASVPAGQLMPMPSGMSYTHAAAIPEAFLTAWSNMVEIAGLRRGETVLIHAGASGVGLAATQIARAMRATVYVTASSGKHDMCLDAGAALAIDYRSENFADRIQSVEADGAGVDVIVDLVGAPYWDDNLRVIRNWGRIVYVGLQGGSEKTINLSHLMQKRLGLFGSTLRNRTVAEKAALVGRFREWAEPRFESGELRPNVWRVMPIGEVREAHEIMRRNENAGKIILELTGAG